jgi:hypothetical protein
MTIVLFSVVGPIRPTSHRHNPCYHQNSNADARPFSSRFASAAATSLAFIVTRNQWRDEMIKRGVARYNWQTGKWEWGEPPSRPY